MENETVISVTRQVPTDVAVIALGDGFLAAWSADEVTSYGFLDVQGRMASAFGVRRIRLGIHSHERDAAAYSSDDPPKTFWPVSERASVFAEDIHLVQIGPKRAVLLMLSLPSSENIGGAYGAAVDLDAPKSARAVRLGPAGEYATQITGVPVDDKLIVAWHDGGLSSSKLRLVRLDPEALSVEKKSVLEGEGVVASPVLVRSSGRTLLAWSETERSDTSPTSFINTAQVSSSLALTSTSAVIKSRFLHPSPDMAAMGDRIGVTYRDDEDRDDTPEYHFALLSPGGASISNTQRISQADGYRGPSLAYFDGVFLGATIRSFQRNLLIGINRFDQQGTKLGGEFQVYADKTNFVRVDIAQNAKTLLMLYAEDRRSSGRVLAGQVMCTDER